MKEVPILESFMRTNEATKQTINKQILLYIINTYELINYTYRRNKATEKHTYKYTYNIYTIYTYIFVYIKMSGCMHDTARNCANICEW